MVAAAHLLLISSKFPRNENQRHTNWKWPQCLESCWCKCSGAVWTEVLEIVATQMPPHEGLELTEPWLELLQISGTLPTWVPQMSMEEDVSTTTLTNLDCCKTKWSPREATTLLLTTLSHMCLTSSMPDLWTKSEENDSYNNNNTIQ